MRAQQDLRGGETAVSVIGTAVNRGIDEWTDPVLHSAAYATGASFRNRFASRNYEVAASITASHVMGSPEAILRTQRSSVHYFQQPGDDHEVDPTRTSLSGHAEQIKFGKYGGGITRFETSLVHQSAGFEVNDLGYLRRADIVDWSTWAALASGARRRAFINWAQLNANHWETWNTSGTRLENALNFNGHIGFKNNWNAHAGGTIGAPGRELLRPLHARRTRAAAIARFLPVVWRERRQPLQGLAVHVGEPVVSAMRAVTWVSLQPSREPAILDPLVRPMSAPTSRAITMTRSGYGNFADAGGQ